jgi:hypothetical protein
MADPIVLNAQQLAQLQTAKATGNAATIWQTLSGFCDIYAANAYTIIQAPTGFLGQVVTAAWNYSGVDLTKFGAVANTYAASYAQQVIDRGGVLPATGQIQVGGQNVPGIEQLYASALDANGVPRSAAIDSTMAQWVWATTLGMEQSRIQGTPAFPSTSTGAFFDKMGEFVLAGIEAGSDYFKYYYNIQDGK